MAERTELDTASHTAPRLAFLATTVVFVGFFVNTFLYVLVDGATMPRIVVALSCLSALMYLQLRVFSNPHSRVRSSTGRTALAAQAALIWLPVLYFGEDWIGLPGFLAGSAVLVLPRLAGWLVFAANALATGALQAHYTGPVIDILYMVMVTTSTGLIVYGLSRLRSLVADLDRARSELAELAVTQQRLRFARELHDVLGISLSAITLKIELACRLVKSSADRAHEELVEVLAVSRQALTDVREVASSYRQPFQDDEAASGTEHRDRVPSMAPRLALLLVGAVFTVYFINGVLWTLDADLGTGGTALTVGCLVGSLALQLGFFGNPHCRQGTLAAYVAFAALAAFTFLPIVAFERPTLGIYGFVAGSALLVLRPPASWVVSGAVLLGVCGLQWAYGGGWFGVGYGIVATMNGALVVYGMSRLRSMVQELHDARSELAEMAVTQEQLRFARDLHDLLGFSLSAITLKCELARRLVVRDPGRATHELREVLVISRQALADVRSVAGSYRELSLDEEARSAEALLRAADIDVTMRLDQGDLPQNVRTTLATVLREGVTNLLRHSNAERCEITLTCSGGTVTMAVVNDGVPMSARRDTGGSGIDNLMTRVRDIDGTLHASGEGGTYRLRAEIPIT